MTLRELLRCAGPNQLAFAFFYGSVIRPFYRLSFLAAAVSCGLLVVLREQPHTLKALEDRFVKDQKGADAFRAWLDVGIGLKVIRKTRHGFRLRGLLSRILAAPRFDPLAAFLCEANTLQHAAITEAPRRIAARDYYALSEHDGEVTARTSRMMEPVIFSVLDRCAPRKGDLKLLDVGCGAGSYLVYVAKRNPQAVAHGVELQDDVAALARERVRAEGLEKRVTIVVSDIRHYRSAERYDLITLHNNLYYFGVGDRCEVLRELYALLRPGGRLVITTECTGGTLAAQMEGLWAALTEGCGRYWSVGEHVAAFEQAGFVEVVAKRVVVADAFYSFEGRSRSDT
ncbi:MAG: class I SAM-dependent methyltransferase [Planctomycetes bacterium]|nr:class I SAM-dependent methyltransferase [Planctomycetota bacterium]